MKDIERVEQAKERALTAFTEPGPSHINCAQAVLHFALDMIGQPLGLIDIARYFGGGVAGMGQVCGAVSGAAMALGARDMLIPGHPEDAAPATRAKLQDIMRRFRAEFGDLSCRELTGYDVSTPEGFKAFKESESSKLCPVYIAWICDQLAPLLAE